MLTFVKALSSKNTWTVPIVQTPVACSTEAVVMSLLEPRKKAPAEYRRQQLSSLQLVSHLLGDTTVIISNSKINYFYLIISK